MQEYHDLFKVVDGLHKWVENTFSNVLSLNLNIIVIKLLYNNRIMIVEPMVQRGLPRCDEIEPVICYTINNCIVSAIREN